MINNLESNYDCSNAGSDLHELQEQLKALHDDADESNQIGEQIRRLENQIHFIKNKCDIHP